MIASGITHGLVVQPGDTLLVAVPDDASPEEVDAVRDGLNAELPDTVKVLLLHGAAQLAVYRPDSGAPCEPA